MHIYQMKEIKEKEEKVVTLEQFSCGSKEGGHAPLQS